MTNNEVLYEMQLELEMHLLNIQAVFRHYNLPLTKVTLIARDPGNDRMIVVLGNEDKAGLEKACFLATMQAEIKYP